MPKLIAVTGATGFIGRATLDALHKASLATRVLARNPDALKDIIDSGDVIQGDLADKAALQRLVRNADVLIHIAGAITARHAGDFHTINAIASQRLAEIAASAGIKRFVYVSSLAAREPSLSDYAASKDAAETLLNALQTSMSLAIVRPPAVYGSGDRATLPLIDQLTRRHGFIPGRPDARVSLLHVADLASALTFLASHQEISGTFELDDGTKGGYSWPQLSSIASQINKRPVKLHFIAKPVVRIASLVSQAKAAITGKPDILTSGKVRELFHHDWAARDNLLNEQSTWQPQITFAEGYPSTLAWYRNHCWLPHAASQIHNSQHAGHGETHL